MNYCTIQFDDSLEHHGILGQKWGVRRYQNPDGSLTPAGIKRYRTDSEGKLTSKGAKNFYKDYKNDYFNKSVEYEFEYDKTDKGKKQLKEYKKAINKMEKSTNWSSRDETEFSKIEKDYLKSQQNYVAKKLISEYGEDKASVFANRGRINTGKNTIQALEAEWWKHAY